MKIEVTHQQGEEFRAQSGPHSIVIDFPPEKGGNDRGMSPPEILLVSLGSCIALYAKRYLQSAKLLLEGLRIEVESVMSTDKPLRLKDINITVHAPEKLGDRKEALLRFIENCPIHNTLKNQPSVSIKIAQ